MIKTYYQLTKPGIIYGNILTALAGFLFACKWHIDVKLFLATIFGLALIIGSACVFNNYIDRGLDVAMARTKKRALVTGEISPRAALVYATILGLVGFGLLATFTNWLTVGMAIIGFVDYIVLYGIFKRRSVYGTIVGSISGSVPIVVGYTAASGRFDGAAALLFLIMTLWQMPHFYAIAMYRRDDYAAAHLPVLPVVQGMRAAKVQILGYIAVFMVAVALLSICGYAGYTYLIILLGVSLVWFYKGIRGFKTTDVKEDIKWARGMFFFSLIVVMTLSATVAFATVLP